MASQSATQHTYRVRGVNKQWDIQKLQSFLVGQGSAEDIQPKIFSLAVEPDGQSQTATVIFKNGKVPSSPICDDEVYIEIDKTFDGITPLFSPPKEQHKVDVIAISGLGGHAFGSFKQKSGGHMWLRDSLPRDLTMESNDGELQPIARILIYGYESRLHNSTSFQSMEDIASSFRTALEDCKLTKPTILIGHSLGGLLVKELLIKWSTSEHHKKLSQAVHGIVFFAVPHSGMDIASLIPLVGYSNRGLLETLNRHNSPALTRQRWQFLRALKEGKHTEVFSYYETQLSNTAQEDQARPDRWNTKGPLAVLVDQASATICGSGEDGPTHMIAINRSHSDIVKFGPLDQSYKNVRGALRGLCERVIEKHEKQKVPHVEVSEATFKRRQRLMDSLKFEQLDERLSTVKPAHGKTYEWILHRPTFRQWKDSSYIPEEHRMIWIKGNPGAGKSTLMKFTYNRIRESANAHTFVTSFFFNARGADLEKTVLGMYRSLLWHILNHFSDLQAVFDDTMLLSPSRENCSVVELQDLLRGAVLSLGDRSLIWFIDALDECEQKEVSDMVHYFEGLATCTLERGINLAICFSSRHYPAIHIQRTRELTLDSDTDHADNLKTYVTDRLRVNDTVVVDKVLAKASNVFLWVVLVVDILNKEDLEGGFAMSQRLEEVPNNLRGLFKDLLGQKTGDMVRDETTKISLLWLLFAEEPLEPIPHWNAIWGGLSSRGMLEEQISPLSNTAGNARDCAERYVVSSSKGLAHVVEESPERRGREKVHLIHESVRDYLLKERGLAELWPELAADIVGLSHAALHQSCMEYWRYWLKSAPQLLDETSDPEDDDAFMGYVIDHLLEHAEAAADAFPQHGFLSTFPIADYTSVWEDYGEQADLLYVLAYDGHERLIVAFLQLEDIAQRNAERTGRYRFPILAAAAGGHRGAFNALLSCEANVYVGADLVEGLNPVEDSRDLHSDATYQYFTPLSWAAAKGYTHMASKLLTQYEEPINEQDRHRYTPLARAARSGNEAMVILLIEEGTDINAGYPLAEASEYSLAGAPRLLMENGVDFNPSYPLARALEYARDTISQLLIEKGGDINAGNPLIEALGEACRSGKSYKEIARYLIEKGADINAGYPLAKASKWGREGTSRLLIEKGADINAGCPLAKASEYGYESISRLLIEKGADINAGYPLAKASKWGYEGISRLLIEKGADINAGYPLARASRRGHEGIARLLIEKGADVNAGYPLVKAAITGNAELVRLLFEQGQADIALVDRYSNTPLDAAVRNRHYDTVDLLLRKGARLSNTSNFANTSLFGWARLGWNNDEENAIVRLLESHRSDNDGCLRDDLAPAGYESVQYEAGKSWCDACTITLAAGTTYYLCRTCDDGELAVCNICWAGGVTCLDDSHKLGDQVVEQTVW